MYVLSSPLSRSTNRTIFSVALFSMWMLPLRWRLQHEKLNKFCDIRSVFDMRLCPYYVGRFSIDVIAALRCRLSLYLVPCWVNCLLLLLLLFSFEICARAQSRTSFLECFKIVKIFQLFESIITFYIHMLMPLIHVHVSNKYGGSDTRLYRFAINQKFPVVSGSSTQSSNSSTSSSSSAHNAHWILRQQQKWVKRTVSTSPFVSSTSSSSSNASFCFKNNFFFYVAPLLLFTHNGLRRVLL